MNYSSRFWLFAPVAIFLGLAVWAMAYWWVATGVLDRKLTALNGHEVAPGITLSFASKSISGIPFNIDVVFTGLVVEGQGAHGPFRWSSEKFALHRLTYGRRKEIYEAAGNQSLSWTDGGGHAHLLKFLPGAMRASSAMDDRGLVQFDLDIGAAGGTDKDDAPFTAARAQFHIRRDPKADALDLAISGDDIRPTGGAAILFGGQIKTMKLFATITQGQAFAPLLAGKASWPAAVADWRAKNGQVSIGPVAISSSGLSLTANAFPDSGNDLRGLLDPLY